MSPELERLIPRIVIAAAILIAVVIASGCRTPTDDEPIRYSQNSHE